MRARILLARSPKTLTNDEGLLVPLVGRHLAVALALGPLAGDVLRSAGWGELLELLVLDCCRILAALRGASLLSVHAGDGTRSGGSYAEARLRGDGRDRPDRADAELVGERSHDLRIELRA